jgi:diketogulonate reductase-like aldo/keto reductase
MRIAALLATKSSAFNSHFFQKAGYSAASTCLLKMSLSDAAASTTALLNCPKITLRNGMEHPAIGFGTYKVGFIPASASAAVVGQAGVVERTAEECVADALSVGYRFLECAQFYGNEHEVGKAIAKSGVKREELFICSKVWTTTIEQGPEAIEKQLESTLTALGTDYVDLYLIHWPVPGKHVDAYKTLEKLQQEGKIRGLGVSNYAWEDYVELKEAGVKELPLVNQIEINPFLYRKNTIAKFAKEGVVMQSYRSLRDGKAFGNPILIKIAEAHQKTPAQILGRWCVQRGFVYVPKSVKKERMVENSQVFDFELTEDEMHTLDGLTTPEALDLFSGLYRKCVNRDTSKDGTMEGVKMDITID